MLTKSQREKARSTAIAAALAPTCPSCGASVKQTDTTPLGMRYVCSAMCERPIFILCWPDKKAADFNHARRGAVESAVDRALDRHEAEMDWRERRLS